MPRIDVNNVTIAYELLGQGAQTIVWTPGALFHRNNTVRSYAVAGHFCERYQILLWDRRNTGGSSIAFEDAPSEFHLWTDDMHHLLKALDRSPAYFGGWSSGAVFSLLMAHRYPKDVNGLIFVEPPGDGSGLSGKLNAGSYRRAAQAAESGGMQAVLDDGVEALRRVVFHTANAEEFDIVARRFAELLSGNPKNRERLLALDPTEFASIMRRWESWAAAERYYLANLTDHELGQIGAAALILPGLDEAHPRSTAAELYRLLPNAEWAEIRNPPAAAPNNFTNPWDCAHDILRFPHITSFLESSATGVTP